MKKLLKITALCCCFVLLLSIMLISNIPKTYANVAGNLFDEPLYRNVYSPDYWVFGNYYRDDSSTPLNTVVIKPMEFFATYLPNTQYLSRVLSTFLEPDLDISMFWSDMGQINSLDNDRFFRWSLNEPQFSYMGLYWDELFLPSSTIVSEHIPVYSDLCVSIELNDVIFDVTYSCKYLSQDSSYPIQFNQTYEYVANGSYLSLIPDFIFSDLTSFGGVKYVYDYTILFIPREWVGSGYIDYRIYGYNIDSDDITDISRLSRNYFASYFDNGGSTIEVNFGAWLLENANSFLAFELLPGFSLSSLLALLVGIPLLLWLFKMLLGG